MQHATLDIHKVSARDRDKGNEKAHHLPGGPQHFPPFLTDFLGGLAPLLPANKYTCMHGRCFPYSRPIFTISARVRANLNSTRTGCHKLISFVSFVYPDIVAWFCLCRTLVL